jgi:hypothetical protein
MLSQLQVAAANETHTVAAVEAVRMEAAAALEEMELAHAAEIERLLEERTRLDSALRCIKDMMNPYPGNTTTVAGAAINNTDGGSGNADGVQQQHEGLDTDDAGAASDQETLDGCIADVYLDAPAVGIPVESSTPLGGCRDGGDGDPLAASYSAFSARYMRPASAASSEARSLHHYLHSASVSTLGAAAGRAPPATVSPAPADFAVFDRAGNRAKVNNMYEMVNALRPGSGDSSTIGGVVEKNHDSYSFAVNEQQADHLLHHSGGGGSSEDNEIFASPRSNNASGSLPTSPESRNRVLMAGGGCAMVDYKGERPDAVTEASMRRILDAPSGSGGSGNKKTSLLQSAVSGDDHEVSYLVRRPSENSTNAQIAIKQEEEQHTTAKAPFHVPCTSAPASTVQSENNDNIIDGTSAWAAGSLSLPVSTTSTPLKECQGDAAGGDGENENYNENADCSWAPTADVLALDKSSPSTANFLTQYMADQVSVRASLPARYHTAVGGGGGSGYAGYGRSSNANVQPRPKSGGPQAVPTKPKAGKIPAIRHSAPGVLKRSTFLQRPLVSDDVLFGA